MTDVMQTENDIFSAHDHDMGSYTTTSPGSEVNVNKTVSAGFSGLRPAVSYNYDRTETTTSSGAVSHTTTTSASVAAPIGKPASVSAYRTWESNYPQSNGDSIKLQSGLGGRLSASSELVVGVRGDLIRQNGDRLSPYFKAIASGGSERSARLEVGACKNVDFGPVLGSHQACLGGSADMMNGRKRFTISTGYTF